MNKSKEYAKNTIILLVGKFATQFMSLILLPLYTHYLLTADYGLVDLYQTYISLFVPVLLLCLDSAIFRHLIDVRDNDEEKKRIISTVFFRLLLQILILLVLSFFLNFVFNIKYFWYIIINIISVMISNIFLQISRGLGKNINYSIACIITGATILLTNILLIVFFKFSANSILIANILGNLLCVAFLSISLKIHKYITIKRYDRDSLKKLLSYSLPLIPNALSWWIVNISDRTIISFFINVSANGIYSVSCKFSNILNSIFSIFTMSWQEMASLHINDEDAPKFFSKMINNIYLLFVFISVFLIFAITIFFNILIGYEYINSYNYIPILILANSFNVLIGLFGGIYIAKKLTKKMTTTTIISAFINITINLLTIKYLGLYAACISTLLSYLAMAIYRYFDVQKYIKIKLHCKSVLISVICFTIAFISYYINNLLFSILMLIFMSIIIITLNKELLKTFTIIILSKKKK